MLLGENLRKMQHQAQQPRGAGAARGASWLAPAAHQMTCIKRLFAHVVILGTPPHTRPTALPLESLDQAFTPLRLFLTIIPTENKKQA